MRILIAEDDAALALAGYVRREQQERIAETPRGTMLVTSAFIRYNGPADWSLDDAGKISKMRENWHRWNGGRETSKP